MPAASVAVDGPEAQLSPVPTDIDHIHHTIYGLVYDLATKKPVRDLELKFALRNPGNVPSTCRTDAHGWFRIGFPRGWLEGPTEVSAVNSPFKTGPVLEKNPPLRSRSDARRRAFAEADACSHRPLTIQIPANAPLAELNIALIPDVWPKGMPPAEQVEADDPPVPGRPAPSWCRFYGIAYDLATRRPIRALPLALVQQDSQAERHLTTDCLGRYSIDIPISDSGATLLSAPDIPGYKPGLAAEEDPPLFDLSASDRHHVADRMGEGFEPLPLSYDCSQQLVRLDLVAVPKRWPKNPPSSENAP